MTSALSFFSNVFAAGTQTRLIAIRVIRWAGGFSLSSILLLFIAFITTVVLRRKGYGVRLGLTCLVLYARPGARRFPDGCEVRVTTRIVTFLFGGCRGPWLDVYAERFYMRLRPTLYNSSLAAVMPPVLKRLLHLLRVGIFAAVDQGYWATLARNIVSRVVAFLIRGLRVRVEKARIWKDRGSWEVRAEQFVLAGRAEGVFGSRYSLSVSELYVDVCKPSAGGLLPPIQIALVLKKGVELTAFLTPRFFTLLRPRKMAIMDDLKITLDVRDVTCSSPDVLDASVGRMTFWLCPGYSRGLRAKLPPSAPMTKRPRRPAVLRYWEGSGAIGHLSVRFTTPTGEHWEGGQGNGAFVRVESVKVDAYGKAADERHEAMTRAAVNIRGCSAGSIAVDAMSHALYESMTSTVESMENVDKIVAARPEALVWLEDMTAGVDINCSKRHSMRIDVGESGGVLALEPVGLALLLHELKDFMALYISGGGRRIKSSSSLETESISSFARSSSGSSLQSLDDEPFTVRLVGDIRHLTVIALAHGPVGDGDTMAIVVSSQTLVVPQIDVVGGKFMRFVGSTTEFSLMHWSQWARTTNIQCKMAKFDVQRGVTDVKRVSLADLAFDWDMDMQSGLESLPGMFKGLMKLKSSKPDGSEHDLEGGILPIRQEQGRLHIPERETREWQERRHHNLMKLLNSWEVSGTNVSISVSFPDGPKMGLFVGEIPKFRLATQQFLGRHVVMSMQDKKCAYAGEFRMSSPLHYMRASLENRSLRIEIEGLRFLLFHNFQFGYILQDWLLRFRSVLRIRREMRQKRSRVPTQKPKRNPLPNITLRFADVEVYFEDHPLGGFLSKMLPLFQDEARERLIREQLMAVRMQQLDRIARAEIAGTAERCARELRKKDSEIWRQRVKQLKASVPNVRIANGYLPELEYAPVSTFVAASLSMDIIMDDLVREYGSAESIRHMKMLDDYELGPKKYKKTRHHERDAWNSIGFRTVGFEANGVRLRFRDYDVAFAVIDRMYFKDTTIGQAVQATKPPYISKTTVAIGRRRLARIVKGLGPTKTYADIHLVIETLQCGWNPSFLGSVGDFSRGVSRFFGGGKNPSPRIPWFDVLRVNMHGRMRITAKKLKGHLSSSTSPYSMTKHYVDVEADNFEMLTSRLESTEEDPFPICWKLRNWHIRPFSFDNNRKSEVLFEYVRVGLQTTTSVLSGDPQDHYFVPFPSKEEVAKGGPGIGSGTTELVFAEAPVVAQDNGFGNYTTWWTGLHDIPGFDSFSSFKTHTMILGIDICVRHPETPRTVPHNVDGSFWVGRRSKDALSAPRPSVLHSDAISTLTKVVTKLVRRPLSCKWSPKRVTKSRKPPSKTGISSTLIGLNVFVDARNLNFVLHNNLEPGHSLFVSVKSLVGELWKKTNIMRTDAGIRRTSVLARRRFNISDIYSSIRVPNLDMGIDADDTGKLLTVDRISLSDDLPSVPTRGSSQPRVEDMLRPASGFGSDDLDESPFYTFSAIHPLQRGEKLDKVVYDQRLLVDRVRLIWSPARRTSMFAWPDAFKEKVFAMKMGKVDLSKNQEDGSRTPDDDSASRSETSMHVHARQNNQERFTAEGLDSEKQDIPHVELTETERDTSIPERLTSMDALDLSIPPSLIPASQDTAKAVRDDGDMKSQKTATDDGTNQVEPQSSPAMLKYRTKATNSRRPVGSMVDLLTPYHSQSKGSDNAHGGTTPKDSSRKPEVLKMTPKYVLFINDCQVAFGSPESSGFVFLTSNVVRAGILDKEIQKNLQLGEANERWTDREYRVHLNQANLYTRCRSFGDFDFSSDVWVPQAHRRAPSLALITRNPICMDLMYISSSSTTREGDEEEDHILRPSLLFINVPDMCVSTNADEFHAATDIVRKVLMQSMRSSELVNEELTNMRFTLQLAGGKISSEELDDVMRRLNNITKQLLYAGDTFQHSLVDRLMLSEQTSFSDTLLRYKAKAKAVATFMRQDQRASSTDVLYPTMYISYSFDRCSWELRETDREMNKEMEHPFVDLALDDLVCRHIFYVGRGSSTEMTFANISAQNKIKSSYFKGILQPATTGTNIGPIGGNRTSGIKASDGSPVAFRWYSTQEDRVGGIPVYQLLTIQVAPMTAAVTRKLYSSISSFIFSTRSKSEEEGEGEDGNLLKGSPSTHRNACRNNGSGHSSIGIDAKASQSMEGSSTGRRVSPMNSSGTVGIRNGGEDAKLDDVSVMAQREESTMLFKYVFIDAFELTASYKNKETTGRGVLDFSDLFVTTPSFSYSSRIWTWKDFSAQIRRDLVMTFARRGVTNLAMIKLLPGYSLLRKQLMQRAETFRDSIYNRLPPVGSSGSGGGGSEDKAPSATFYESMTGDEEVGEGIGGRSEESSSDGGSGDDEDNEIAIDAAVADISAATEGRRREAILEGLYGRRGREERRGKRVGNGHRGHGRARTVSGSDSSEQSRGMVGRRRWH